MKELLAPVVFLALFLGIVGGSLWATPHIAAWIDKKRDASPSPYGEEPEQPDGEAEQETVEEEQK